jgi:hypothetical protein
MKLRAITLFTAFLFALALLFTASAPAVPATPSPRPLPAAVPEEHPQIRDAIAALRRAKEHLEHAAHDFGGHRVDAVKATNAAIQQLEICLKYDK